MAVQIASGQVVDALDWAALFLALATDVGPQVIHPE